MDEQPWSLGSVSGIGLVFLQAQSETLHTPSDGMIRVCAGQADSVYFIEPGDYTYPTYINDGFKFPEQPHL